MTAESLAEAMTAEAFASDVGANAGQVADLRVFHDHLVLWNDRINLVGPSTLPHFWRRHVLDSAQLLHVEQSALQWADIGAGAGFPGLVLAILLKGRAGAQVHLVESIAKRVRFLELVSSDLNLPVRIHHGRAERIPPPVGLEIVTARACAPFPRLFEYTAAFFQAGARGLFLKGRDVESELTKARQDWTFQADLIPSRSDPMGRLVRIEGLKRRGR